MLKREVEIGGEYAWQERYAFPGDEYRKVELLKFLSNPGGRHVLVRDKDGEFETHLERLVKPWSELGPKEKEAEFRTRHEKYEQGERLAQERDQPTITKSWTVMPRLRSAGRGGSTSAGAPSMKPSCVRRLRGPFAAVDSGGAT